MSQAHFQGRFEVEFKYKLTDRPAFLKALLALNPEIMLEDNLEQDRYFDTPDNALAQAGKSLVIRTMQPSGIQLWIVKGPEMDRCEAVTINDADKAVSMLLTINYRQILVITKRRSIYFIGPFHVTLDHLAGIGDFAELAIMTDDEERLPAFRQQLLALADQLGLSPDAQAPRSYRTLYTRYTRYMQAIHTTQAEDATQ
ncbi:class IV adenylate cyclase [Aeromonas veronii]|uniref:class IV adenylate cyclase n=1 Tax=Aeromonas veronii TaxID=654 RepID=UPI00366AE77F